MTEPLPKDLAISLYGGCLAEPFQERLKGYPRRKVIKEDHLGRRKRTVALVSVRGREYLVDVVTGTLYCPVTGMGLNQNAWLLLTGSKGKNRICNVVPRGSGANDEALEVGGLGEE